MEVVEDGAVEVAAEVKLSREQIIEKMSAGIAVEAPREREEAARRAERFLLAEAEKVQGWCGRGCCQGAVVVTC